jgi:hypothetical protein
MFWKHDMYLVYEVRILAVSCTINGLAKKYYIITVHHKVHDAHPHRARS